MDVILTRGGSLFELNAFEVYPYDGGVLERLLHRIRISWDGWLKYIDEYDHTVFNSCQMTPLLAEWRAMKAVIHDEEELIAIEAIEKLMVECSKKPGAFITFKGD